MNQSSGLRFDIYERVQLTEENEDIGQLEEIELIPSIELNVDDTQAVLSGHLQLSGSYSNLRSVQQQLEHKIPVEITLPLHRIKNADNIGIEIENFDVELLSARTLNVTGVLSLSGLELNRPDQVNWASEEAVFVHEKTDSRQKTTVQAETSDWRSAAAEETSAEAEKADSDFTPEKAENFRSASDQSAESGSSFGSASSSADRTTEAEQKQAAELEAAAERSSSRRLEASEHVQAEAASSRNAEETLTDAESDEAAAADEDEEKRKLVQEPKIAFSKQQNDESNAFTKQLSTVFNKETQSSLVQSRETSNEDQAEPSADAVQEEAERAAEDEQEQAAVSENGLEWKKLFLSQEEEEAQQFSRLKLCIVQKDETIETIAERYQLNPREILLYNRLNDETSLTEGQIVYIPQTQE